MLPSDAGLWLAYTSVIDYPIIPAALRLNIFDCIAKNRKATIAVVAAKCDMGLRSAAIILNHLASLGILHKQKDAFLLPPSAAAYLVSSQSSYWGEALLAAKNIFPLYERLMQAIEADKQAQACRNE